MADPTSHSSAYEVYCHGCRVTFPVETKRCIHCGNRLGRGGRPVPLSAARPVPTQGPPSATTPEETRLPPILGGPPGDDEEDEEPRRGFNPSTLIWLILVVAGMYRSCTTG